MIYGRLDSYRMNRYLESSYIHASAYSPDRLFNNMMFFFSSVWV